MILEEEKRTDEAGAFAERGSFEGRERVKYFSVFLEIPSDLRDVDFFHERTAEDDDVR